MTIQAYGKIEQLKTLTPTQSKTNSPGKTAQVTGTNKNEIYFSQFRLETSQNSTKNFQTQNGLYHLSHNTDFNISQLKHEDKSILELSPEEATELVSADGYWGIDKTSKRLTEFVLNGAGDNLEKLRAGREGIIHGFKEAEKLWGGQLPEISYKTIEKALAQIDKKIQDLGGSVVDKTA